MAIVLLFGVWPVCKYMLYLIYVVLGIVMLLSYFYSKQSTVQLGKSKATALLKRKRREREAEFTRLYQELKGKLEESEVNGISSLRLEELQIGIRRGDLKAVQILDAYMLKALEVTKEFNCVTDFNPRAQEIARTLDLRFEKDQELVGPLHGIPVCIKEDHDVEGMDTTLGYAQLLSQPAKSSSTLVRSLIELGAIPFCKTNVPQTLLSNGSHNPIFGTTFNPVNSELSPAGSSSGSACLIKAGGALFGTGSDFGGSLRTPAHFCGISSIKPTIGRLSAKGMKPCTPCMGLPSVPGILGSSSATVAEVFKYLVEDALQHRLDPTCPPITWNDRQFRSISTLKIGYLTSMPFFPSIGDTPDTILKAKCFLEKEGHVCLPFELSDTFELNALFSEIASADNGYFLRRMLELEPEISPDFTGTWPAFDMGSWERKLRSFLLSKTWFPNHSKRLSLMLGAGVKDIPELWQKWERRNQLRSRLLDRMKESSVDVVILPVFAMPAISMEDNRPLILASYTPIWSLLDLPAGVTPFGEETGMKVASYDDQGDSLLGLGKTASAKSTGMPVGVQIISKPFHEETVLRVMCLLEGTVPT